LVYRHQAVAKKGNRNASIQTLGLLAGSHGLTAPAAGSIKGWYLESGFDYNFGRGHERSIG
jgi:hypothetical protein